MGSVGEVVIKNDHQGVYSLMTANKDVICIAWATMTWSPEHGGDEYVVSGDFGKLCGGLVSQRHVSHKRTSKETDVLLDRCEYVYFP